MGTMNSGFGPDPQHYGYSAAAYQPGAETRKNTAGRVSLVAGIVLGVVGLGQRVVSVMLPHLMHQYDLSVAEASLRFTLITGVVTVSIAVVALIAGGIGLSGSGKPKAAAGAGFALGASAVVGVLFMLLAPSIAMALV